MKNTHLIKILFLLITPINLLAQQKLTEFQVKIARPADAYVLSDSNGYLACIFQNTKEYEVDFLDPKYKVIGTSVTQKIRSDKNQEIIGGVLNPAYCYAYFYNKKVKAFSILEIKRSSGEAAYSRIQIFNNNEQFLKAFEMDGKFYVLIVPKFTNNVRVLVMDGKNVEEKNFNTEMPSFYTALSKNNDMLNTPLHSEVGIEEIDYKLESNIKSTFPGKKLYHYDGKIVMTFDEPNLTHMVTFDLNANSSSYKKLNFSLDKGNNSGQKQGNSFLHKNRFFRTTMSPDQLNITIIDLDSMKLLNAYNFFPGDEIKIQNTPLLQEGGTGFLTEEKELKKSEQFFKRVLSGNLAIAANELDSSRYSLDLGSYEIYTTNGYRTPGSSFGGPSISIGMGMGMGMGMGFGYPMTMGSGFYPGYSGYPGYYNSQPVNRLKVVYFKSLLNKEDFSHIEGTVPQSMNSKINDYEYKAFRSTAPDVLRVNAYQNKMLLGYYSKYGKKFNLVEFSR